MPKITPMMEILADLTKPVEEIKEIILAVANSRPGEQQEILVQIDIWLGEVLSNIEKQSIREGG